MARPRKIRSEPTAGVGGRPLTERESAALIEVGERFGFDSDDDGETADFLDRLHWLHCSYLADRNARANQVGVADERRDLHAIVADLKHVRQLLIDRADDTDSLACIAPAAMLADRLRSFPNMIGAETTRLSAGVEFMHAQFHVINSVIRVRFWPENRARLIADMDLMLSVCDTVAMPAGFTKRHNSARDRFQDDLAALYMDTLHPQRVALWRAVREERDDPPPPESRSLFAREVMRVLGVPFEVKRSKG